MQISCGMTDRPQRIAFAEMRDMGVRGVPIYCQDFRCSHSTAISRDGWADDVRLSNLEARFVCRACGKRGADVRPDFNWNRTPVKAMGYRYSPAGLLRQIVSRHGRSLERRLAFLVEEFRHAYLTINRAAWDRPRHLPCDG
jgi:hypothetical protein